MLHRSDSKHGRLIVNSTDSTGRPLLAISLDNERVVFRNFVITAHARKRYQQRFGGTVANMIADLVDCQLFTPSEKRHSQRIRFSTNGLNERGMYALEKDKAVFIVCPNRNSHVITTTLRNIM